LITDAIFGEAIGHFKLRIFDKAKHCMERAIECHEDGAMESKETMKFIKAMCNKNLGLYQEASA